MASDDTFATSQWSTTNEGRKNKNGAGQMEEGKLRKRRGKGKRKTKGSFITLALMQGRGKILRFEKEGQKPIWG